VWVKCIPTSMLTAVTTRKGAEEHLVKRHRVPACVQVGALDGMCREMTSSQRRWNRTFHLQEKNGFVGPARGSPPACTCLYGSCAARQRRLRLRQDAPTKICGPLLTASAPLPACGGLHGDAS
jgi:hypothetical protein